MLSTEQDYDVIIAADNWYAITAERFSQNVANAKSLPYEACALRLDKRLAAPGWLPSNSSRESHYLPLRGRTFLIAHTFSKFKDSGFVESTWRVQNTVALEMVGADDAGNGGQITGQSLQIAIPDHLDIPAPVRIVRPAPFAVQFLDMPLP